MSIDRIQFRVRLACQLAAVRGIALGALLIAGCTKDSKPDPLDCVNSLTANRSPHVVRWGQDESIKAKIDEMLRRPMNADDAAQVALFNNHSLQATFEDLRVSEADLVQAGLMTNPRFFASVRFIDVSPRTPDSEFSVVADFLDLILIPLKKSIAEDRLAEAERRVADAVLGVERDVRVSFAMYQSRLQAIAMLKAVDDAQAASLELSRAQHQAGNISDLDLANEEAAYSSMKLELLRAEAQARIDREELNRLMGLWGQASSAWQAVDRLPDLPEKNPPLAHLESKAVAQRLDLAAARLQTNLLARSLKMADQYRFSGLEIGIDTEHDPSGYNVTGPQLSIELPIFDQKQAQIARLSAEYRQSFDRFTALAVDIRSQVRAARDRMLAAAELARMYRDQVVPQRQKASQLSRLHYNMMVLGIDRWLMARQAEFSANKEYIEAVRDYWIARAELDRAVGGRLAP